MIIHLIGLGGAGKTTTGKLLSKIMNIPYFDLDEYFIERVGDIAKFINSNGYNTYAKRNVELYIQLKQSLIEGSQSIFIFSSGFMTYSENTTVEYSELKQNIEHDSFTFLLMPSLDINECIEIIVKRQLNRSYLQTTVEKEEGKVRKRFEIYKNFGCHNVLTNQSVDRVVWDVRAIIKAEDC